MTPTGRKTDLFSDFPEQFIALHWYGDRFSIPAGAIHAARSEGCEQQAFAFGGHAVGGQFHLEATEESIAALIRNAGEEISGGRYIQDPPSIEEGVSHLPCAHMLLDRLLARMVLG
jgi:GMP synthase (glutamine-hydrolysing)